MSRCLRDKILLSLYEGSGTSAHRAHLESCAACAARYERWVHDLEVIGQALREAPPPGAFASPPHPLRVRWVPAAAALAVAIALVGGGIWMRRSAPPVTLDEEVLPFLEEVSAALFSTVEADMVAIAAPASNWIELESAREEGWPCEGAGLFYDLGSLEGPGWDQESFPLLWEGE